MIAVYILLSVNLIVVAADLVYTITKHHKEPKLEPVRSVSDDLLTIRYSDQLLDFIQRIAVQSSVMKYKEFVDNHEIDKITRTQVQNLVTDTTVETKERINLDIINYDDLLYDRQFLEIYIIQTSITSIKRLLEKSVQEVTE